MLDRKPLARAAHLPWDPFPNYKGGPIHWGRSNGKNISFKTEYIADRIILLAQGKLEAESGAEWLRTLVTMGVDELKISRDMGGSIYDDLFIGSRQVELII